MFAINAFGLPIVFGLANLIDLFGRNWEIYKTRATDKKAKKIWQKELRKYLICFPFYLVVPFEKSFLFPEEEAGLIAYSHNKDIRNIIFQLISFKWYQRDLKSVNTRRKYDTGLFF